MLGGASLVHAGLGATSTGAFTDLSGLEGLVNNTVGGSTDGLQSHHTGVGHHYPHHSHHHHHHHPSVHHHSSFSFHHHPNQPLPPHRPFTPPGALNSHIHSSLVSSGDNSANSSNAHTSHSYSPNSTSHMPTSTVKIKSGNYYSISYKWNKGLSAVDICTKCSKTELETCWLKEGEGDLTPLWENDIKIIWIKRLAKPRTKVIIHREREIWAPTTT